MINASLTAQDWTGHVCFGIVRQDLIVSCHQNSGPRRVLMVLEALLAASWQCLERMGHVSNAEADPWQVDTDDTHVVVELTSLFCR